MENEEYDTIDLLEVLNAVRQHLAILILAHWLLRLSVLPSPSLL